MDANYARGIGLSIAVDWSDKIPLVLYSVVDNGETRGKSCVVRGPMRNEEKVHARPKRDGS